jgi:hypothetical protein
MREKSKIGINPDLLFRVRNICDVSLFRSRER